jgi:hypothetical protein
MGRWKVVAACSTLWAALGASCARSSCPPISKSPPPWIPISSAEPQPVPETPIGDIDVGCVLDGGSCSPFSRPVPRCLATNPGCGPEFVPRVPHGDWPIWHGPNGESGEKCYRPEAKRYAERGPMIDRCDHDGECQMGDCGLCLSYRRGQVLCSKVMMEMADGVVVPPDAEPIPPHWCGCVDHRCTMFEQ